MVFVRAFVCGGLLCVVAQFLIDLTPITPARILVGYVCAGVILAGLGLYLPFVEFAGCGATVPLTGFGYTLAKGVVEAIDRYGAIGILTGGLTGASGGIAAAIFFSILTGVIFRGKPENL